MKQRSNFFTYFIISLTFFLLGMGISFVGGKKIISSMGKTEEVSLETKTDEEIKKENVKKRLNLEKLWEVYDYIDEHYYDVESIDKELLVQATISGLVEGLGDRHSEYMTKKESENFEELLTGDFEGIGAVVDKTDYGIKLDMIFKGSGAEEVGLKKGDVILKVDGEDIIELELEEAIGKIKGPAGTTVELEVYREGNDKPLTFTVPRKKIDIPSVEFETFENNIGYIEINTFGEKTADDVLKALIELKDTQGLIIDLRNNGGGYLESAAEILSDFIESGEKLVVTKVKGGKIESISKSRNTGNIYTGKIVVLVNENSASASEIVTATLRDYDKAIIVGKKTYGKGTVQIPHYFPDGSMLKLTVSKWFTAKDENIDKIGIQPDIEVDFTDEDFDNVYDRQLEVAKRILPIFIEKDAKQLSIDSYKETFPENKIEN